MAEDEIRIKPTPIVQEMRRSYIDYSMSVIVSRALPDVRDGLKPVQRRLIYAMDELGLRHDRPHKKSARPVAETMGKYHPHGESAIYDALVRLSQPFNMRYPLVDGHGNFGSIDGDPAAAMRYTEARLTAVSESLLSDLDKETVDFVPNFDESLKEPTVLPARVPNLMINGSSGIAVGMATNIPPHNLGEVLDALEALIENPNLGSLELMEYVKGPDFPGGGLLIGTEAIKSVYTTGRGVMTLRARTRIETDKKDRQSIIVEELPYQVNKARLIENIANLVRDKRVVGITDLRDESDKDEGIRVVIEVRRDVEAEVVLNQLFKHTALQTSFGAIMIALVNSRPETLDLRGMLWNYLMHRKEIVIRRTQYDLRKAEERAHILLGLVVALDNIDAVIALIRASANPREALAGLMENFDLDEIQARAILEMTLQRLTRLERDRIVSEREQLLKEIEYFKAVLGSERMVLGIIGKEFQEVRESFSDSRKTLIVDKVEDITEEDLIIEQDVTVLLTNMGYIKRMPVSSYRTQRRGGMGATAMQTREEDWVEKIIPATTKQSLLVFTTSGKTYWLRVYDIPEAGKTAKGHLVSRLVQTEEGERVTAAIPVDVNSEGDLLFVTRQGICKRTSISEFSSVRKSGIRALNLKKGDSLVTVKEVTDDDEILIATYNGQALRMGVIDVRPMGRSAAGVIGMRLEKGDYVIGADVIHEGEMVLLVSEEGYGKFSDVEEFPVYRRGSKGVVALKTSEKSGQLTIMRLVAPEGELLLVTALGVAIRTPLEHVKKLRRSALGVRLMRVDEGDRLVASGIVDPE